MEAVGVGVVLLALAISLAWAGARERNLFTLLAPRSTRSYQNLARLSRKGSVCFICACVCFMCVCVCRCVRVVVLIKWVSGRGASRQSVELVDHVEQHVELIRRLRQVNEHKVVEKFLSSLQGKQR